MSYPSRKIINFPPEVEAVLREFRTCEMSTLAKDGTPITWPVLPFWRPEEGRFLITTSVGLPQKAFNVRRNPHVSLLFSDPTASGLIHSSAVLVQGTAEAPDEVVTSIVGFEDEMRQVFQRQPASGVYSSNPFARYLFDWYYMRLLIHVTSHRLLWWPEGDFQRTPLEAEIEDVG
ncbi:MAG: pyridoxamine 5'-phosphate oxidase family protein [Rubrobacter sp.]|nr:pyridoxamine 5'-phosphate oxidase family protein [Rubrobacter sp.]